MMNQVSLQRIQINPPVDRSEISEILSIAKTNLEKDGYWVFPTGNTERSTLIKLAECFGKRQCHAQSDREGIREVTGKRSPQKETNCKQQYLGNTNTEHKIHTDGTFLDGIAKTKEGRLVQIEPPQLVLLQMVRPAASGGASLVLDCKSILEDALQNDPQLIYILLQPCVVYSRDDQCARSPVFACISPGLWSIRWRYDFATLIESDACDAFNLFYRKYVSNPKYLKRFYLQAGEILVTDNWRLLHGREAFNDDPEKPRLLRRLWVARKERVFLNPLGQPQHQRVYDRYQPYSCIEPVEGRNPLISVSTGIRLDPDSQAIAERMLLGSRE